MGFHTLGLVCHTECITAFLWKMERKFFYTQYTNTESQSFFYYLFIDDSQDMQEKNVCDQTTSCIDDCDINDVTVATTSHKGLNCSDENSADTIIVHESVQATDRDINDNAIDGPKAKAKRARQMTYLTDESEDDIVTSVQRKKVGSSSDAIKAKNKGSSSASCNEVPRKQNPWSASDLQLLQQRFKHFTKPPDNKSIKMLQEQAPSLQCRTVAQIKTRAWALLQSLAKKRV